MHVTSLTHATYACQQNFFSSCNMLVFQTNRLSSMADFVTEKEMTLSIYSYQNKYIVWGHEFKLCRYIYYFSSIHIYTNVTSKWDQLAHLFLLNNNYNLRDVCLWPADKYRFQFFFWWWKPVSSQLTNMDLSRAHFCSKPPSMKPDWNCSASIGHAVRL